MKKSPSLRTAWMSTLALFICGSLAAEDAPGAAATAEAAEGLWRYTALTTRDGTDMPLAGVFLFKDGIFVQQALFEGTPYEEQGSMAHAGPFEVNDGWVKLVAEQQIHAAPLQDSPLTFQQGVEHEVTVDRDGDNLTLIFGRGTSTVQEFARVGPGEGELHALQDGVLALVDGHFVLVQGTAGSVATGYGSYTRDGDGLTLNITRWAESDGAEVTNLRDTTMTATLDDQAFTLEDGRSFPLAD